MNRSFAALCAMAVLLLLTAPAAVAAPKFTATAKVLRAAAGSQLEVVLQSRKATSARTRPRSVTATVGAKKLKLKRVSAGKRRSVWRSAVLGAADAAALDGLAGKALPLAIGTRSGTARPKPSLTGAPAAVAPVGPAPAAPGGPAPISPPPAGAQPPAAQVPMAPPGLTLKRDDAAAQSALARAGDLKLERYLSQGSVTMEIARAFFYGNGVFRFYRVDWNSVSGEMCNSASRLEGTWSLKEGYTFPEQGGGIVAKLGVVANGQASDEVLVALNNDPAKVFVGSAQLIFDVNQNMRDSC